MQLHSIKFAIRLLSITKSAVLGKRNMRVSVVGGPGKVGELLAYHLKYDPHVKDLAYCDITRKLRTGSTDILEIPTRARYNSHGAKELAFALKDSNLVVVAAGILRGEGDCYNCEQVFEANAKIVHDVAKTYCKACPSAFLVLVTNPINSLVPVAAEVLKRYETFNPQKLIGVTAVDVLRSKRYIAEMKRMLDPTCVSINVVCGHSASTAVPVFSKVTPHLFFDSNTLPILTEKIRSYESKIRCDFFNCYAAMTFITTLIRAIKGEHDLQECAFTYEDKYEIKYWAGPVKLGKSGVQIVRQTEQYSKFEMNMLEKAKPFLVKDIDRGEKYIARLSNMSYS